MTATIGRFESESQVLIRRTAGSVAATSPEVPASSSACWSSALPMPRRRCSGCTARSTHATVVLSRTGSSRESADDGVPGDRGAVGAVHRAARRDEAASQGDEVARRPGELVGAVGALAGGPHLAPGGEALVVRAGPEDLSAPPVLPGGATQLWLDD